MKNVVVGLFDRIADAERVLEHLASSPLDLDTIQVVHAQTDVQRRLGQAAGLPPRRSVRNGLVIGLLAGAGLGFLAALPSVAGGLPLLTELGPMLAMAAGAIIGALAGGAVGAFSDNVRLPPEHAEAILAALREGAAVIMVHTENLPTARAIGDLFRAGGSRIFEPGHPLAIDDEAVAAAAAAEAALYGRGRGEPVTGDLDGISEAGPDGTPAEPEVPDAHLPYAPPWRRADGGDGGDADAWPSDGVPDGTPGVEAPIPIAAEASTDEWAEARADSAESVAISADTVAGSAGTATESTESTAESTEPAAGSADTATDSAAVDARWAEAVDEAVESPTDPPVATPAGNGELSGLGLSARVVRPLTEAGITDVAALRTLSDQGDAALLSVRGIGPTGVTEIRAGLARVES